MNTSRWKRSCVCTHAAPQSFLRWSVLLCIKQNVTLNFQSFLSLESECGIGPLSRKESPQLSDPGVPLGANNLMGRPWLSVLGLYPPLMT